MSQAFLDGFVLDGDVAAAWATRRGVAPFATGITCARETAEAIMAGASRAGSSLRLVDDENGTEVVYRKLTAVGLSPTNSRDLLTVDLRDIRWLLGYIQITRVFNERMPTGQRKRLDSPDGQPVQVRDVIDKETYRPVTIRGGETRWTAKGMLENVLEEIKAKLDIEFDLEAFPDKADYPIEDVNLFGAGDAVLAQLLGYFGDSIAFYVDEAGTLIFYDRVDGGEGDVLGVEVSGGRGGIGATRTRDAQGNPQSSLGPLIRDEAVFELQDRKMERPSKVRVLFTRAIELRIDALEDTRLADQGERGDTPLRMDNIYPTPDPTFALADGTEVVQGTLITINEFFSSPEAGISVPLDLNQPPLSHERVRFLWFGSALEASYAPFAEDETAVMARRLGVLRASYRLAFQFDKRWAHRVRGIKPYRVAVTDAARAIRGKSPVYADYAVQHPSYHVFRQEGQPKGARKFISNVFADGTADGGPIISAPASKLSAAPAEVKIIDEKLGVFLIVFKANVNEGEMAIVAQGALVNEAEADFEAPLTALDYAKLRPNHELSIIVTVGMAAPNDNRQLHAVDVAPADVASLLGVDPGPAEGPVLEVRVPPTEALARFAWDDANAQGIRDAFRYSDRDDGDPTVALGEPTNGGPDDELQAVAKLYAARAYASFMDHLEGGATVGLTPGVPLRGTMESVLHVIGTGGALTTVNLPPEAPKQDLIAQLPGPVRRLVYRELDP